VAERYGRLLARTTQAVFGSAATIAFAGARPRRVRSGFLVATPPESQGSAELAAGPSSPGTPSEQFIIGDGNRLAHAAALAVAESPGGAYNHCSSTHRPGWARPTSSTPSVTT